MSELGRKVVGLISEALVHVDDDHRPSFTLWERQELLNMIQIGRLDEIFHHGTATTTRLRYRAALERTLPRLSDDDREWIALWARWYSEKLTLELQVGRAAKDVTEHDDWLRLRQGLGEHEQRQTQQRMTRNDTIMEALRAGPARDLQRLLVSLQANQPGGWKTDETSQIKAYILACLSELAYAQLTDYELEGRDKYKLFQPSQLRVVLQERRLRINLAEALAFLEYPVRVLEIGEYVYLTLDLWGVVIVAVRGTRPPSISDWVMNFDARKTRWRHAALHRGFAEEARNAIGPLEEVIEDRPVLFTGHSQGAAVAGLLSIFWNRSSPLKPYLFACPRFASAAATVRFPRLQFTQSYDLVPHVPPRFLGFSDGAAKVTVLPDVRHDRPYAAQVAEARHYGLSACLWFWLRHRSADQHLVEHYRFKLGILSGHPQAATAYVDALREHLFKLEEPQTA